MVTSTADDIALAQAVAERFPGLCDLYQRTRGMQLVPPAELRRDFIRWRQMVVRHRSGDFRHTETELRSTKEIASWTVQVNCVLRNQPPRHIRWE